MDELEPLGLGGTAYLGRYTPKGSSKVWKHFFLLRDYPSKAFCSHCCSDPLTVASGEGVMTYHEGGKSGTSSMKKHLERKHNLFLDSGPRLDVVAVGGSSGSKSPPSTDVSSPHIISPESPPSSVIPFQAGSRDVGNAPGQPNPRQNLLRDSLLRSFVRNVVINDLKPFQVTEDRGLREFLRDLQPNFKAEDASTVRSAFDCLYSEIISSAPSRHLSEEDEHLIALSGYGFEFPLAKEEFVFGLVLSWIDRDWTENRMVCYSTGDSETELGTVLAETMSSHGFPTCRTELFAVVCDGSRVVETSDMQATILPMGSTVLKLALDSVLDGPESDSIVVKLLTKVRRLADYLRALHAWNQSVKNQNSGEAYGVQDVELNSEDPERLVSICDLLRSVCSKKESIEAVIPRTNQDHEGVLLTDEDFVTVSQLASVLDSLREAADILECQAHVRLSLFYPVLRILMQKLDKSFPIQVLQSSYGDGEKLEIKEEQLEPSARMVRARLRQHLRRKLNSLNEHQVALMSLAAALDPRFKALRFLSSEEQDTVWRRLLELMGQKEDSKTSLILVPSAKRSKLASFFGDVVATEGADCGPEEELEAYKKMPQVLVTSDPLRWWQEHGDSFSRLKVLARRYLPIPTQRPQGSRVNLETVRFLRTQMDKETLARLLFAHENSDHW